MPPLREKYNHGKLCKQCSAPLPKWDQTYCSLSCTAIAREKYRKSNGLYSKKFSDDVVRKALELVNNGQYWKAAATSIGMSHDAFRKRARRLGCGVVFRRGCLKAKAPLRIKLPNDRAEIGYLAAMVDGEGHIIIHEGHRKQVFVGISNTDENLMKWLASIGGAISKKSKNKLSRKICYTWTVCARRDTEVFLRAIEPFLKIKRSKALNGLRALEEYARQDKWEESTNTPSGFNLAQLEADLKAVAV